MRSRWYGLYLIEIRRLFRKCKSYKREVCCQVVIVLTGNIGAEKLEETDDKKRKSRREGERK